MTLREYKAKEHHYLLSKYEQDCRFRKVAYSVVVPHLGENELTIYEFDPLEFDPSPEEITMALYKEALEKRKGINWKLEKQIQ